MNDHQLENKVRRDADKVKKDLSTLVEDSVARVGRIEDNVSHAAGKAKEELTTWVGDGVSQMSEGIEKLTDDAKKSVIGGVATLKKDVGHGLSQYNAKVQEAAGNVPGGFGEKVTTYPWVAISIALAVGFLLGGFLKPARKLHG